MPQVTVNRSAIAILIKLDVTSDWENDIQDAANASSVSNFASTGLSTNSLAIRAANNLGRGGSTGTISRVFAYWDSFGAASGNTITGLTLRVAPYLNNSGDVIVAKVSTTPSSNTYVASNFNDYTSTAYSLVQDAIAWPTTTSTSNTYDITLSSNAVNDANTNGYLSLVLMNHEHDFQVSEPSIGTDKKNGMMINGTTPNTKLIIDYTVAGYTQNAFSIADSNIDKIIGVSKTNVGKFIGVS